MQHADMNPSPRATKRIAVLGSTGSIGKSTLDVLAASDGAYQPVLLSCHSSTADLKAQAAKFRPRYVVATDSKAFAATDWSDLPSGCRALCGPEAIEQLVQTAEIDCVVASIVGCAGLKSTWAALEAGKTVALANKEALVVAGPLMLELARRTGAAMLPVDSEHSAVFQALQAGRRQEVKKIWLTASGGPFRRHTQAQLEAVTPAEALRHPTWAMGPKISIDSATMMNKALEIIEARWLFDLSADQIGVVVHPQSIVHSMVEYVDGSVIAQLSPPDMKLPIQYALAYPSRHAGVAAKMDWSQAWQLHFEPPDLERFPALELGLDVARAGGTAGAVVNAANEAAVQCFLQGEIRFVEIVPACRRILEQHDFEANPTLDRLLEIDRWARQEVLRWVCT